MEGLFQLFVETVLERLSKIEAALARQDRYKVQQKSRRLAAARKMETVAPHEDFAQLGEDLRALATAVDLVRADAVAAC